MEKMLFEFNYKDDTIYCIVDFYESFVPHSNMAHVNCLYKSYEFCTSFIISVDEIEEVTLLQRRIYDQCVKCIDSFFSLSADFKKRWNLYCDSVPRVYQFEKESLFKDSKISKFNSKFKSKN